MKRFFQNLFLIILEVFRSPGTDSFINLRTSKVNKSNRRIFLAGLSLFSKSKNDQAQVDANFKKLEERVNTLEKDLGKKVSNKFKLVFITLFILILILLSVASFIAFQDPISTEQKSISDGCFNLVEVGAGTLFGLISGKAIE